LKKRNYWDPGQLLRNAWAKTTLIAPKPGKIYGMKHHDKGREVAVDLELAKAVPGEFDALLLPGGALNADALRVDKHPQDIVPQIDRAARPIAFICHAPWLRVSAGLTKGRTLTSYHSIQDDIRNAGGNWVDEQAVRDRNWVSSRQPSDIPQFNEAMIELFAGGKARAKAPDAEESRL
jgi:protease I